MTEPAGVELKFQRTRRLNRRGCVVLGVAEDGVAKAEEMRAQLVGAAGVRLKGKPGGARAGAGDCLVVGLRRLAVRVAGTDGADPLEVLGAELGEWQVDQSSAGSGIPATIAQ